MSSNRGVFKRGYSPSLKTFLEFVSNHCYAQSCHYNFTKDRQISKGYKKGQLQALEYIAHLSSYFLDRERGLKVAFIDAIYEELERITTLKDSDYKDGLYDALKRLLDELLVQEGM